MKVMLAIVTLVCISAVGTACYPMTDVTFRNETQENLEFYTQYYQAPVLDGTKTVKARSSAVYDMVPAGYTRLRVAATREDGEWVFDHIFTRDELERAKRTITVSSLEPIAPPSDVRVNPSQDAPVPRLAPTRTPVAGGGAPASSQGRTGAATAR